MKCYRPFVSRVGVELFAQPNASDRPDRYKLMLFAQKQTCAADEDERTNRGINRNSPSLEKGIADAPGLQKEFNEKSKAGEQAGKEK